MVIGLLSTAKTVVIIFFYIYIYNAQQTITRNYCAVKNIIIYYNSYVNDITTYIIGQEMFFFL